MPGEAQGDVVQILSGKGKFYHPIEWANISRMTISGQTSDHMLTVEQWDEDDLHFDMTDTEVRSGQTVPHVTITTDEPMEQIPDKTNYKSATIEIRGFGRYDDVTSAVNVRGRGNSSWTISDKKPYRLKFSKKIELCGLTKAKNYVLIANWTDHSLIQNALASKLGHMLEVPFTHTFVPVDVTFNGVYRGCYTLTDKPGINAGSVNIDEENSVMWELDVAMDEDFCFTSPIYNLPVMLADPDMSGEQFEEWKQDFIEMEKAVQTGQADKWIDLDEFARYVLVYEIMGNSEIGFPKSVKLFKTKGEKYIFSPLWDFDCCMGYVWEKGESYTADKVTQELWLSSFMTRLSQYVQVKSARKEHFNRLMKSEDEIERFIDEYASLIESSAKRNYERWERGFEWEDKKAEMKRWLRLRLDWLKTKYSE